MRFWDKSFPYILSFIDDSFMPNWHEKDVTIDYPRTGGYNAILESMENFLNTKFLSFPNQ